MIVADGRAHIDLLEAYRATGDRAARDRLVEEMMPLVHSLARRYAGRGEPVDRPHDEVRAQQEALGMKLRGHFGYYGIPGNSKAIMLFLFKVAEVWCKWLNRRSQRASMTWPRMHQLLERYPLPRPRITHPLLPRAASP